MTISHSGLLFLGQPVG